MIKAIVCVDEKWAIGKNNDLLFHLKKDMQFFKEKTEYSIIVMGENTLLSLPNSKPLKNRINIVLCPSEHKYTNCVCFHDFDKLVAQLKALNNDTTDIYVIGGGMLYNSMLPYYDEVYVTKVKADGAGTVFFPNLDTNTDFELTDCSEDIEDGSYILNFCTYKRI